MTAQSPRSRAQIDPNRRVAVVSSEADVTAHSVNLVGGRVLTGDRFETADLAIEDGLVSSRPAGNALTLDAGGLYVLPGVVDVHGDAFERQVMPRPGVSFDLDFALRETDRQLAANGITTACHGLTWSWEPGLRGSDAAHRFVAAITRLAPVLGVESRIHLRYEAHNVDAVAQIISWMSEGRIAVLAFNDHMASTLRDLEKPAKLAKTIERSGLDVGDFRALVERTLGRSAEVPAAIETLAAAARSAGIVMMSHDDRSPADRQRFRQLGCSVAEFPTTIEAAEAAQDGNDWVVFGAPNVVRGGSHTGSPDAAAMVEAGLCNVLASDYYYPSLLAAPFLLADRGVLPLAEAWALVSEHAAAAIALPDRGQLNPGMRGDAVVVEHEPGGWPRVMATIVAGRIVHCSDAGRIRAG